MVAGGDPLSSGNGRPGGRVVERPLARPRLELGAAGRLCPAAAASWPPPPGRPWPRPTRSALPGPADLAADANRRLAEPGGGRRWRRYPGSRAASTCDGAARPVRRADRPPGRRQAGRRRDPPPLETGRSAGWSGAPSPWPGRSPLVEVRDVGPSRVGAGRRPGRGTAGRPRLRRLGDGPADRAGAAAGAGSARYRLAAGLALGGVVLAARAGGGLGRTLQPAAGGAGAPPRRAAAGRAPGRPGPAARRGGPRGPQPARRRSARRSSSGSGCPARPARPESLAAVVGAVDRLDALVGRLLLFARAGHEPRRAGGPERRRRPRRLDLLAGPGRRAGRGPRARPDAGPAAGRRRPARPSAQVVLNLLTNALQAMPGRRPARAARPAARPAGRSNSAVADTGPGCPAADRDRAVRAVLHDPPRRDRAGPGPVPRDRRRPRRADRAGLEPSGPGADVPRRPARPAGPPPGGSPP